MIGAVIGDICGSIYEGTGYKEIPRAFRHPRCRVTDDSVLTAAVASGFLKTADRLGSDWRSHAQLEKVLTDNVREEMLRFVKEYPYAGYGGSFLRWYRSEDHGPYNSWGNGSAMRTSCCGWAATSVEEAGKFAAWIAAITHNHPEGIKGASVVSECIFLLRSGGGKEAVLQAAQNAYDMNFTLEEIRPTYRFDISCQGSVPQAIRAFLEAASFEETAGLAISLGGDADTQAAIACSLAECYYEIPRELLDFADYLMKPDLKDAVSQAEQLFGGR